MTAQPRAVDIHRYYRTGGINYIKFKANFDFVIIQACVGDRPNELLEEQVTGCKSVNLDYETYCVPDPAEDPVWQADFYLDLPGVSEAPKYGDIEPTGGQMVSEYQARKFLERIDQKSAGKAGYYSNYAYTKTLGNPQWIKERDVWWAEYRYAPPLYLYKFSMFEPFFEKYPWWIPKWAAVFSITPILHQLTDKGDAQHYGANPTTNDPQYGTGIKSMDLNAGLVDLDEYYERRFDPYSTAPPPLTDKEKLDKLWAAHPELH